jgi:hypothetical protein
MKQNYKNTVNKKSRISISLILLWVFGMTFLPTTKLQAENQQDSSVFNLISQQSTAKIGAGIVSDFYDQVHQVRRYREVELAENILSPVVFRKEDKLNLNFFEDASYTGTLISAQTNLYGTNTLAFRIDGFNFAYMVISTTDGRSYAEIYIPETGANYVITSDPASMQHYLIELDYEPDLEPEDAPVLIPPEPTEQVRLEQERIRQELMTRQTGPFDPATIDLLFAYTPAAKTWADNSGGGLLNRMANKLAWGQIALDNSDVIVQLRLVLITETNYTESGTSGTDLARFRNPSDGYMDEIHPKRNAVGVDLCILFTQTGDFGGVAYLLEDANGRPDLGFSVTRITQSSSGLTFIHEIGHNLGCQHHKLQNVQPGPTIWSNWPPPDVNLWSAGWRWTGTNNVRYCDLMTYTSGSYFPDGLSHARVPHFSNPNITFQGVPTGHAADGDNARTIRFTKHVVAAYRSTVVDCKPCPDFDFDITPSTAWQTHSSAIAGNYDCKIYRIPVTTGNKYTFKTGCGDGASANFNSFLELYDEDCFMVAYNDNGCAPSTSIVYSHFNYTGYAYLKVRSDTTGNGAYTLAYKYETFADPCSGITTITGVGPANLQTFTGGGTGSWFNSLPNDCGTLALGKQQIYDLNLPNHGWYNIVVSSANGHADYLSNWMCNSANWSCIGGSDVPATLGPVQLSNNYLMLEMKDLTPDSHTFYLELVCGAVSNLQATPGATDVTFTWTEPVPPPVNGYEIHYYAHSFPPNPTTINIPSGVSLYTITGLPSGTSHGFSFSSICSGGLTMTEPGWFTTIGYDYGDAPEMALAYPDLNVMGNFPTCASVGPVGSFIRHAGNSELFLGLSVDYEGDGNADNCSPFGPYNMDECFQDGDAGLFFPGAHTIYHYAGTDIVLPCPDSPVQELGVAGSVAVWGSNIDFHLENHLNQDAYFSVLIDWDQNGTWFGPAEQVLLNFPVPALFNGPLAALNLPDFVIGSNPGYVWARFSLTDVPVNPTWTGRGDFNYGETEDYLLFIEPPAGICDPPMNFVVSAATTDATFDWAPVPGQGYELAIMQAGNVVDFIAVPAGTSAITVAGLTPATTYTAFIRSDCGWALFSNWETIQFTTAIPPCDPPVNLTVAHGSTFADLVWVAPAYLPMHGFEIELIDQNGVSIFIDTVSQSTNNYLITGLIPNSTYSAGVKSLCAGGLIAEEWITFITDPAPFGEDFGDAPAPYPTLLADNGARHVIDHNIYLGAGVDSEPDGQPDPYALGDDRDGNDDEDGVKFLNSFVPGQTVGIEFTVQGSGYINAWFDWNANGSWADAGDHAIVDFAVTTGVHVYTITVPASATTGMTFSRFRFSTQQGLSYEGPAPDGEVEDYRIRINPPETHKMHFPQYPDPAGWDVNITHPAKVADDWMCSQTGYVEDFHFWVSWKNDLQPLSGVTFSMEIYSDLPAHLSPTGYSMPDSLLWARNFAPGSYNYTLAFQHPQGWFDPNVPHHVLWDHLNCYRVDIDNFNNPFLQTAGTVYWLAITAQVPLIKTLNEEAIILYLNNIPPDIQPGDEWTESGAVLSILPHPEFQQSPGYFIYPEGGLILNQAMLNIDLSELDLDDMEIERIEIDINEFAGPGSTWAELLDGDELIDMDFSLEPGEQTLMLNYADLPDKLNMTQLSVISVRLPAVNAFVSAVRIVVFPRPAQHRIGWKTSLDHFNDIAVRQHPDPGIRWATLFDPVKTHDSLSMAFVITGKPVTPSGYDFGDAPDAPYPTLLANNGARHGIVPHLYLGAGVDPEPDGQPDPYALGDDQDGNDDEDGVKFLNSFVPGQTVGIEFTVQGSGYINGWFDWDANGSWADAGDHAIVDFAVTTGVHVYTITVPSTAGPGMTFSRFRLSSQQGLSYDGAAPDGEVEDYRIRINPPEDHKMHFPQYPDPAGWDVNITYPSKVGDDWMCSETGYVEDFHFWVSWKNDQQPFSGVTFTIEIYSDLPAHSSPTGYSMPDSLLWARDFAPGDYNYYLDFSHPQGWYNPNIPQHNVWDHLNCYRVDIDNFNDPFLQVVNTVYWLVITAHVPAFKTLDEEVIELHLNNIPPGIQPGEAWYESGVWSSIHAHPDFPDIEYMVHDSGITLGPATLISDLSGIPGEVMLVEVLFTEHGDPGSTLLQLSEGDFVIDSQTSSVTGDQSVVLFNSMPAKSELDKITPLAVSISALYATISQINIYIISLPPQYMIGWKTSPDHFNDIAVWKNPAAGIDWQTLFNPMNADDSLSMAFIITGNPVPPDLVIIEDYIFTAGDEFCIEADDIIIKNVIIEGGADVTVVAKNSIKIQPDTDISGRFHALIDDSGSYCLNEPGVVTLATEEIIQPILPQTGKDESLFRVFPNPTPGLFNLEQKDAKESAFITVEIYNMLGERIISAQLPPADLYQFDLSERQSGIYLIRVMMGNEVKVGTIVKR